MRAHSREQTYLKFKIIHSNYTRVFFSRFGLVNAHPYPIQQNETKQKRKLHLWICRTGDAVVGCAFYTHRCQLQRFTKWKERERKTSNKIKCRRNAVQAHSLTM